MSGRRQPGGAAERVVFALSAGIVLVLAGAIGWLWVRDRDPVMLKVSKTEIERRADGHAYVSSELRNDGDETAEAVQVIAEVSVDGETVADGEQTVDFLSGGETQELVFVFAEIPPGADVEVRAASYTVP